MAVTSAAPFVEYLLAYSEPVDELNFKSPPEIVPPVATKFDKIIKYGLEEKLETVIESVPDPEVLPNS